MVSSYISFEAILLQTDVIFQYYSHIYSASYRTREKECDQYRYIYRRLKYHLLIQTDGVIVGDLYCMATPKRAFLDMVYLRKSYYEDVQHEGGAF